MKATGRLLLLLLCAALALRAGAAVWWQHRLGEGFAFGDSESYWSLARSLAAGQPYRYGAADSEVFRAPGYPTILAGVFLIGGDHPPVLWGRLVGALCGTAAVGAVWWLGRTLFHPEAGWLAGAITAAYPGAIATSVLVLSEAAFCPVMLLQLALWIQAWRAQTTRAAAGWAIAAGLAAGAATLIRPSWLLFVPFAAAIGVVVGPDRRRHLALAGAMLVVLVAVMTPWVLRNQRAVGRPVLTTTQLGASLYDGLNPEADGSSRMDFERRFIEEERVAPSAADEPLECRLDRRMRAAALDWAALHPTEVARLAGVKFLRMWNVWPNEPSLSAWPVRAAVAGTYLPVLVLGAVGAVGMIRRGWPFVLCWLPAAYLTLVHVVFVSSIRYRQPAMLGLIVLAAGAATGLGKRNEAGSVPRQA
ncbi:MAG: glycosyltransferase family 39 protein [Pirellulales bacterium]|nr:glycosyltransferase family 39 protein [Pirellulales bacterium]